MLFDDEDDDLVDESGDVSSYASIADEGLPEPRMANDITGHRDIEKQLVELATSGKMPHALIFSGPVGIGKSTMAFRLAKFLLSQKPAEDTGPSLFGAPEPVPTPSDLRFDAEGQGPRLVSSSGHPDLLTLARKPDDKTGIMKESLDVEQVRSVGPFLHLTPFMGGWRMVIIDDSETMTRSSQNALLKVLEEPPPNSLLILIAHKAGLLIPTIKSRCRVIEFSQLDRNDFSSLMKRAAPQTGDLDALYNIAEGSIGTALRLSESGALKSLDQLTSLLTSWPAINWTDVHMMGEVLNAKGQDNGLQGFQDVFLWTVEQITRCKARGFTKLPEPLNSGPYPALLNDYTLEHWSKICDNLHTHFLTAKYGSLDRRQTVLGAFSILKGATS